MLDARLNEVTLGVHDLPLVRSFYERLGWVSHSDGDEFARFETGGATLALFLADSLAGEALAGETPPAGYGGFTMGVVVGSPEAVDAALQAAREAGALVVGGAVQREWGRQVRLLRPRRQRLGGRVAARGVVRGRRSPCLALIVDRPGRGREPNDERPAADSALHRPHGRRGPLHDRE